MMHRTTTTMEIVGSGFGLLLAALLPSHGQTKMNGPKAFLHSPDIHDDRVVFTCEGDLWLKDLGSGALQRLTREEGVETSAKFSPDGSQIAFSASYDGLPEIYVMPVSGGTPRRLTYQMGQAGVLDWTPDGKCVVFRGKGQLQPWGASVLAVAVFQVSATGGYPVRLPLEFASHLSFAPDGKQFVFTRFPIAGQAWFRYQGGEKNDLWVGNATTKQFRRIYGMKTTSEYPVWGRDRIYFVQHESDGSFSLMTVNPDGSSPRQLAGPYDRELRNLRTDGRRLIYEKGTELEVFDIETGKATVLTLDLGSDLLHTRPYLAPAEEFVCFAHLGPTGKRILVETRGQIISVPVKGGEARTVLAKDGVRFRGAVMSPDAKHIAYISDESREQQLYVADPDGSNPKAMTSDTGRQLRSVSWAPDSGWLALTDSETRLRLIGFDTGKTIEIEHGMGWNAPEFTFSPDSRWLAFTKVARPVPLSLFLGPRRYHSLVLYEIATGKRTQLGDGIPDDFAPSFSTDGKWLGFLSRRNIDPHQDAFLQELWTDNSTKAYLLALSKDTRSPFLPDDDEEAAAFQPEKKEVQEPKDDKKPDALTKIDLDNLAARLVEIPVAPANYLQMAVGGDRVLLLVQSTNSPAPRSGPEGDSLIYYDLKDKKSGKITDGVRSLQLSADGKKVLLYNSSKSRVVDVSEQEIKTNITKVNFAEFQLRINPTAEWENMYWDGWRLIRDYFYVTNLHGADWEAIGQKYASQLGSLRSRDELNEVLRWVLAELNVSHAGVRGGDNRSLAKSAPPAFLGVDLEPDPSGYYQITKILRGDGFKESERSPLAAAGLNVKEGDFLIELAGMPALEGSNFLQGLLGRTNQVIALKVNTQPTAEGARTLRVRPVASEDRMRYLEWVNEKRAYVTKATQGRIGYLHVPDMTESGMADFIKQYFPLRDKEALVIDTRFNRGGYISDFLITVLSKKLMLQFHQRSLPQPWTLQSDCFLGPMACLINEFNASDAEQFPYYWKALGLGPLVGRRTWGGEVGSAPGWMLADGGIIAVPNYGAFSAKEGWVIEGTGVSPEFDIENDPNAYARGQDPQLDKAIQLLTESLKTNPVTPPQVPPDPIRAKGSVRQPRPGQ